MKKQWLPALRRSKWWAAVAVVAATVGLVNPIVAQTTPSDLSAIIAADQMAFLDANTSVPVTVDSSVQQAGCSGCVSGAVSGGGLLTGCSSCGGSGCIPGRFHHCDYCNAQTCCGRIVCGLYECICCPDPCYEPRWIPAANAAFFVDTARPRTHTRLRADFSYGMNHPDRATYFWAPIDSGAVLVDGRPCPQPAAFNGPSCGDGAETNVDYREFNFYTEAAAGNFAAFLEIPYRHVDPEVYQSFSGFSDMSVGTKSMMLDCELIQITFQFKTTLPVGNAREGLGNGHVSMEPSLLWSLRLAPDTYFQGQTAYWFPISGDYFAGDIFHYHLSLNQVLCRPMCDVELIATAELNGWDIMDGAQTHPAGGDPLAPVIQDAKAHIMSAGPGLRLSICDKIDFGYGTAFGFTEERWHKHFHRFEVRFLF